MIDTNKLLSSTRIPATGMLLLSLMGFTSCSSVPDAVNPIEWYRGASGWFESDKDQAQRDQANTAKETAPPLPGSDKPYPNLSTVPERPRSVSSPEERNKVQQGLAADRANARYTKPETGRPSGSDVGAPVAAPRTPVLVAPGGPSPETLEALPPDIAPPPQPAPTSPQSLRDDARPAPAADASQMPPAEPPAPQAVETPTIQAAAYQTATADTGHMTDAAPMAVPAMMSDAPPSPAPRSVTPQSQAELAQALAAEQSSMIVAQQASLPPAEASRRQDLPRSFMVYFTGGTATLDGVDKDVLRDVARLYRSHGGTLRVVGHASSATREKDAYKNQIVNLRISTQRAEAVAGELVRLGVPRDQMTVAGVSDSEPLYAETTQAGIAGNRRVEIFFGP